MNKLHVFVLAGLMTGMLASQTARAETRSETRGMNAGVTRANVEKASGNPKRAERANDAVHGKAGLLEKNTAVTGATTEAAPATKAESKAEQRRSKSSRVSRKSRRNSAKAAQPLRYVAHQREQYREIIARHAAANGIPFSLADAVIRVESRYNPRASNGGAIGLMQIKTRTAHGVGYRGNSSGLMDPETNIKYGMKYLAGAYRMAGGDTCGTVMRYQSGHYAKRMNRANMAYCAKVRSITASMEGVETASAN